MTDYPAKFSLLPELFRRHPVLTGRAKRARITMLLCAGAARCLLILRDGTLRVEKADGPMDCWDIALRGDATVWDDHWLKLPPPDAADIFGMRRHGRMEIEGNFLPLMQHLQLVKDILALPRTEA